MLSASCGPSWTDPGTSGDSSIQMNPEHNHKAASNEDPPSPCHEGLYTSLWDSSPSSLVPSAIKASVFTLIDGQWDGQSFITSTECRVSRRCPSLMKTVHRSRKTRWECVCGIIFEKLQAALLVEKKPNEIAGFFFQASGEHKAIKVSAISNTHDQRKEGSFHLGGIRGGLGKLVWFPTNSLMYTSQFGNAIT